MENYIKVKALEHDGDWFLVPNDIVDEFKRLTDKFNSDDYPNRYNDEEEFEKYFGHLRTEGDLNLVQLYIK